MGDTTGDLLLHLTTPPEWRAALAAVAVSPPSLSGVGSVHLSTPAQGTAPGVRRRVAGRGSAVVGRTWDVVRPV